MPTSNSRLAYEDCYELLNQAMDDPAGIRAEVASKNDAIALRTRLHTARKIDRVDNTLIYQPDEPMHARSVYDVLQVKLREYEGKHYVYLVKISLNHKVESLSEIQDNQLEPPRPMKLLNSPKTARRV